MKKVILLNGSPRGRLSMSLKLAETFAEGYLSVQEADVVRIDLAEQDIRPCSGCYACWRNGAGACVKKDGMAGLLDLYARADLVLVSTPVYHFGMTAILKAFFERSLPLNYPYMVKKGGLFTHPERIAINPNQAVGLFATCGFPDADNFRAMRAHFEKLLGARLRFEFLCPEGELLKVPQMREATAPRLAALKDAGAVFARSGRVPPEAEAAVASPMVETGAFARLANTSWSVPGEIPPTEAQFAGLEPYGPTSGTEASLTELGPGEAAPSPAYALLEQMRALFNPVAAAGLESVLEFDFTDVGEVYQLSISKGECALAAGAISKATTKIVVPFSTWQQISSGELRGEEALMKGAYRVEGDFGLMMKIGSIFGRADESEAAGKAPLKKRPNLLSVAFAPWYCAWFLGGSFWLGQALPLALALAFLAYRERRREATWFERGTAIAFAFIAAMALASPAFFSARWSGLCNAAIAFIWSLSLLYRRPLTSDYSKSDYSGSVASGPIFRAVNFGLTALWSFLFAAEAVAGLCLAGISQGRISLASAILLIPAGLFTAWFPKWYPTHLARRGGPAAARG